MRFVGMSLVATVEIMALEKEIRERVLQRFLFIVAIIITLLVSLIALWPDDELPPIKVGILHSLTGTMAISEKPVVNATLLAIEQINANGGLLGRRVEAIVADGKSDGPTFALEAERLITQENVSVVFGCWTSASRKAVKPVFEKYNHLLFYPVQYEGLEQSPNIIYTGATPNQQIIPALSWAFKQFGPRIYLVGSDYVFPRVANMIMGKLTPALGGSIVGESYLPLGSTDVSTTIEEIKRLKPDVVMNTINGDSNIAFFHQLREAGITADQIPVVSFSIGEAELSHMMKDRDAEGHFAAWNYFQSVDSPQNRDFIHAYQSRFGKDLPVSDPMEAAWSGVKIWAEAVKTSQTDETEIVLQAALGQSIAAPEGIISIDHQTQHSWKTVRIGKIQFDGQFSILWTSDDAIRPDPYPSLLSKLEAADYLDQLYKGWGDHWALQPKTSPEKQTNPGSMP